MDYSYRFGRLMFSVLYLLEGVYFLANAFNYHGNGINCSLYLLLGWLICWAVVEWIGQSDAPKNVVMFRLVKTGLISVFACAAAFVDNSLPVMLVFYVLTWLSANLILTLNDCKLILLEQLLGLIFYVSLELLFLKNPVEKLTIAFAVVIILYCRWIVENLIKGRIESKMRGRVQRQSAEDMVKVIEAKCQEARVATRSKSSFLANMSHEIRTPINAVLGLDELILRESNEDTIKGYARDIKSAGNSLLNLVNDVLDFSKIESGKMELVAVDYDLPSLLNNLVNMIHLKAQEKNLKLELEFDSSLPRILYGDEVRMKQIITNILTNAVKYTDEGVIRFEVGYEKIGDFQINLRVSIEDTGKGMKAEDISKLFKPFERIEESKNHHVEGTGLGMAITQTFLNMMGSSLEVKSEYGQGSCFSFTVKQEVVNWECMGNYEAAFNRLHQANDIYQPSFMAPMAKILVVDDVPLNITVLTGLIKETKVNIDTATSGSVAVNLCKENKYDVIFMDHMMPVMDGIEALHTIRADENTLNRDTPMIALTANAISGSREMYISEGFEDYLSKPIDPRRLEKLLKAYIQESKLILDAIVPVNADVLKSGAENKLDKLRDIIDIDVDAGIMAAGSQRTFETVISEFATTTDYRCGLIEDYYKTADIHNYTIQVHALKSSARLIGAVKLSDLARRLEDAGNTGDLDTINKYTEGLINQYKRIGCALGNIVFDEVKDKDLPIISTDELNEAIMIISEGAQNYDIDMITAVMEQLSEYSLPDDFKEKYKKLKQYIALVDFDSIIEVINSMLAKYV